MPPFPFLPDHNDLIRTRYDKARAMREAGFNPYPAAYEASHLAAQVLENAEKLTADATEVSLLGRAMTIRSFGKTAFFHLRDRSGQIQVYLKAGQTSETGMRLYREFLDGGDLVGVRGTLFRTKTGELTVQASELVIAAKAVRQLPEKWHGLQDKELRYRQRYLDLIANPEVADTFRLRSRMVSTLRRTLDDMGFMEVETPMMQALYGGASARPFATHHNALDMPLYMRIAPELYLKRLVVGGLDRVYEINRNFRNEGIDTQHNPEFTMLELYAGGWNCARMMDFCEDLLRRTITTTTGAAVRPNAEGEPIDFGAPFERVTILDAVARYAGFQVHWDMSPEEVARACPGQPFPDAAKSTADRIMFLVEEKVEDRLLQPTYLVEFPKAISPLAKSIDGRPEVADRFELFVNRMELANGFSELNDPEEQFARFAEQVERRKGGDLEAVGQIDEDYVRALEHGMVPTAGIGIGIDRLVMLAAGVASIRDVILFPLMKPLPAEDSAPAPQPAAQSAE